MKKWNFKFLKIFVGPTYVDKSIFDHDLIELLNRTKMEEFLYKTQQIHQLMD